MKPSYAFIGAGNMGRALMGGLIAAGHSTSQIRAADPVSGSREACAARFGIDVFENNGEAACGADVVVLAVKPQQMREVAMDLAARAGDRQLYLSIAAGITVDHLSRWLGGDRAIVRCMPNTPALVGAGASALYANANVSAAQRTLAGGLLEAVGIAIWLDDEGLMDAVTALSGSGPAYFFLLLELLERGAADLGLPAELARRLAIETAHGAALLARESDQEPASLRRQVTSPGGTTERALMSFDAAGLEGIVADALRAARDRSIELARSVDT
jgi:pyrroline-5-carboxylate reductase